MYEILKLIKESALFSNYQVITFLDEETVKLLKVKAEIVDGSVLFITEMHKESYQRYSYHWQEANGDLIMRWDNKPHWRDFTTFPHHKHKGTEVLPCHRVTLEEVLSEIRARQRQTSAF